MTGKADDRDSAVAANRASSRAAREGKGARNLAQFFAQSPLRGSKLKIERVNDGPRPVVRKP